MELDLRGDLDILKRHKWIIIEAAVVVAVVAAILTALRTPTYTATAKVLLRPNDPSETVDPSSVAHSAVDPDRNVSAQINILQSGPVADGAAKELKGSSALELQRHLSVHQAGQNDILNVSGHDVDPSRARDVANAFAHAYIENRRQFAVGNLQSAADGIQAKLVQLQDRIAQLDTRIKDGGPAAPGTANAVPTAPTSKGAAGPTGPANTAITPDLSTGALPTDSETLVAARYAAQVQYQSLFQQQQDIAVDISLKRGEAELISEADTPTSPSSASPKRNGALGLVVGLLLGVAIALLREQLNDKIRSRRDAEDVTGLPVLAELPFDADASQDEDWVSAADMPLGGLAEAVRTLRTSLQFLSVDEEIRRIVVTSAGPGDGKSFVAANLAVVYAQAGLRTVLVSGDVRRPRLATMFGISRSSRGLTDILADHSAVGRPMDDGTVFASPVHARHNGGHEGFDGPSEWWEPSTGASAEWRGSMDLEAAPSPERRILAEALVPTRVANLALLPAGPTPPNPAELLGSKRSAALLAELSRLADIVIIDTPPVLAVTDAAILAEQADGVLLVAALGETKKGTAERARSMLSAGHSRLLGVVLNKVEASQSYYYGYYGDTDRNQTDEVAEDAKPKRKSRESRRALARRAG